MATKNPHGMTDRMWAFCRRYVEQGFTDAAKAYRLSFPGCKSQKAAESGASRLLVSAKVSAYLAEVKGKAKERTQVTAAMVLAELVKIGFSDMANYAEWSKGGVMLYASEDLTPDMTAAVSEITETVTKDGGSLRFKLHDKRAALDSIGKHFGMFTDKRDAAHGGEPGSNDWTPEHFQALWVQLKMCKSLAEIEKMFVKMAKKQMGHPPTGVFNGMLG